MNRALNKILRNRVTIPFTPFYRRYPYTGRISVSSADDRGCVDMELGFFYNRIPKAANSTVIINWTRLKFGMEIASKAAKKMFKTLSALHALEVTRFSLLFKFTVVRNPYTRTLSAYLDKVERPALRDNKENSFRDFLYSLQKGKLYSNAHWEPQSALLLLPANQFDFIGKVESLETDLPLIKEKIQKKGPERRFKSSLNNSTGASRKLKAYYDVETAELVRMLFRDDFETFGYPDTLPVTDCIQPETGNTGL